MYKTIDDLIDIEQSGDREKNSFHIKQNLKELQTEFPYLHDTMSVGRAIEQILRKQKDEKLILHAIERIGTTTNSKYVKRNYALILADIYLEENNPSGINTIILDFLEDEFQFKGFRKLLVHYSENYDEQKFLEAFQKIEKRNTLMPKDRNAINLFIEKYASNIDDIRDGKKLIGKKKIYSKVEDYIIPLTVGYYKNRKNLDSLEEFVSTEISDIYSRFFYTEEIYNQLYSRSIDRKHQLLLLSKIEELAFRTPKDLKVKGYPGKLWSLILWRVGCKYLELNEKNKVESIIVLLKGKNKESLETLFKEKYTEN